LPACCHWARSAARLTAPLNCWPATASTATHGIVASINPASGSGAWHIYSKDSDVAVTVEAHYAHGGLFSMASRGNRGKWLAMPPAPLRCEQMPDGETGDLAYMHERHGLSSQLIAAKVRQVLNKLEVSCKAR